MKNTDGARQVPHANSNGCIFPGSDSWKQEPIAVISLACRLPGNCTNPSKLWHLLQRGGIASIAPPENRFNFKGHYDASGRPRTMASPGGMFLEDVDPRDIDAQFFRLSRTEANAMDPQQRQLLETVYEGLENAGLRLEDVNDKNYGCFVGSYACDYQDIQSRDPEDRAPGTTIGVGRAMLSNRISHFLNIKGPSMTIDTACSASLVGLELACRYLTTGEMEGAIVAGANMYLSPEHVMDYLATSGTSSGSGRCHTFDDKADGYIKAEAINVVILRRLSDAVRDGQPIRAIIRGSATNSDGWTAGIASPNSSAQAAAIRKAYQNAGLKDLSQTQYLEFHGTGTQAGDPIEFAAVSSVFSEHRSQSNPLLIGSIKSNIGHSEPASGLSGLIKVILSMEKGFIPGNPTFINPRKGLDFAGTHLSPSKSLRPWPKADIRRASVNSFGYGGSNVHVVLESASSYDLVPTNFVQAERSDDDDIFSTEDTSSRPYLLVITGNDEQGLVGNHQMLSKHIVDPHFKTLASDLAYTINEKRTRHFKQGYAVLQNGKLSALHIGGSRSKQPRIGFIFTGQGSQWPTMGKHLIDHFPRARQTIEKLNNALQELPEKPEWNILDELHASRTNEQYRQPIYSQTLVTALQLVFIDLLKSWGIQPAAVIGHSSGEIAAAVAAGLLTAEEAIKIAYYKGYAASTVTKNTEDAVGMMAVGLGAEDVKKYIETEDEVEIACYNGPTSITLSGSVARLQAVHEKLQADSVFSRILLVDLAYHSKKMTDIAANYEAILNKNVHTKPEARTEDSVKWYSTVTNSLNSAESCTNSYWKENMVNPVLFSQTLEIMLQAESNLDILLEVGPSNTLEAPARDIVEASNLRTVKPNYLAICKRGKDALYTAFDTAGKLYSQGCAIDTQIVNNDGKNNHSLVVDLPNYSWNHTAKYWYESNASKDWRFRKFPEHDLLGTKIFGTPWSCPLWSKKLRLSDLGWLSDHKLGSDVVFPAAGYISMAAEACYQHDVSTGIVNEDKTIQDVGIHFRNVSFLKAMVLTTTSDTNIYLSLKRSFQSSGVWHEFEVFSKDDGVTSVHCQGLVAVNALESRVNADAIAPFQYGSDAKLWYKVMREAGYTFGPSFQKQIEIEAVAGSRNNRVSISLENPPSAVIQSPYAFHPACIDACFQTAAPSLWQCHRSSVNAMLIPTFIESLIMNPQGGYSATGIAEASAIYSGYGNEDIPESHKATAWVYDSQTATEVLSFSGLQFSRLDNRSTTKSATVYTKLSWDADISFVDQSKIDDAYQATYADEEPVTDTSIRTISSLTRLYDLLCHKTSRPRVAELISSNQSGSVWLDNNQTASARAFKSYTLIATDQQSLISARNRYSDIPGVQVMLAAAALQSFAGDMSTLLDVLILNTPSTEKVDLDALLGDYRSFIDANGCALLLWASSNEILELCQDCVAGTHTECDITLSQITKTNTVDQKLLAATREKPTGCLSIHEDGPDSRELGLLAYLNNVSSSNIDLSRQMYQLSFLSAETRPSIVHPSTNKSLECITSVDQIQQVEDGSIVVVLDETNESIMSSLKSEHWNILQTLITKKVKIMWVTEGGQMHVSHPSRALISGFARTLRAEDPSIQFVVLDVQDKSSAASRAAIDKLLLRLASGEKQVMTDSEYVERDGVFYISRLQPDNNLNTKEELLGQSSKSVTQALHEHKSCVRLVCTQPGSIGSLEYVEISQQEIPLGSREVEVEVYAASLNFKDVAVTLGLVRADLTKLGLEGAGIVRRLGSEVNHLQIGQRVLVSRKGCFGNRVQAPVEGVHPIPDDLSFEDAATIPIVYLVALYGLVDLANVQPGQSVLIHSAAGGVGIAALHLCRWLKADIYVTVGTQDKRDYLKQEFGIPESRMFTSRSTAFVPELMKATGGRGVDVVLNSLSGELLDASWRCIADGGIFVEIGKKDMIDRKTLSMEPFIRNASYRPIDISHEPSVSFAVVDSLLHRILALYREGHIKAIHPQKVFSFTQIADAFRYMQKGVHMGKIIIADPNYRDVEVPVRQASQELTLSQDKSYLIVGGLKGLCGSLAIYMARHGAKNLTIMSRSGYNDSKSQAVLHNLSALGVSTQLVQGDVAVSGDVERAFDASSKPMAGAVLGAMVLRDKVFQAMTVEDYHAALECKVSGAWNIHNAALARSMNLDFFSLLSSVSGVVGQKSQANYAAANTFLDAFAAYRQSLGLAACSVDLGVIEDIGYISERESIAKRLDSTVWQGINEGLLHRILAASVHQQAETQKFSPSRAQIVTGIPFPQLPGSYLLFDPRFRSLGAAATADSFGGAANIDEHGSETAALLALVKSKADHATLFKATVEVVNNKLKHILGMDEALEEEKPLSAYGIDSLAAIELRNWIRADFAGEITTLEVTNAKTLLSLTEKILEKAGW